MTYINPLASAEDLADFRMEGPGVTSFPQGRLRIESTAPASDGQRANCVLWCPFDAGPDVRISWDFWPVREPGLCILFFHASGHHGRDLFDPQLQPRTGPYHQYFNGDLDTYHLSYFRRRWESERRFHLCNLRKSQGHHLVAQAPDPLPSVPDAQAPYHLSVEVRGGHITFQIDDLRVLEWFDDGGVAGPPLRGGKVGFRQMAPMIGEYANLEIAPLRPSP